MQNQVLGADKSIEQINQERMNLFKKAETITQIPWYVLASVDQYERNVRRTRNDIPKAKGVIGIYIRPEVWAGMQNPDQSDTNPTSISLFGGMGIDGNGDGKAEPDNDEDVLFTFAAYLLSYGIDLENIKIGLWDYYQRDKTIGLISGHMKLFQKYGRLDLDQHSFPVPIRFNYSFKNTWGDARGWGGRRIHEGTDIFANYGVPVSSTCYGIVEMKGWNRFGGWRLGIRDSSNTYHYFAHLNGFADGLQVGQIVEPGQLIGSVGSSGYGPPGTSGKFPPHLHYGMYKDNGRTEWSYDPYPQLKVWERAEYRKRKRK
ncbi:M23 family metallopeptidase [Bacillus sp. CMF21]|uniref:M23 family metallopeptidase n=1 Tax=Metabacillus dongyingensis TaxID=2874282 RepID=UPI001CBB49E8|nr:M23 family metallopeptidase [Metabacillus dongyingensis]UAL54863.1 M23 family metallopeptidase [Metabacillus dongyingensis]UOK59986.1 M23 family metallopeptidase [Bacillus sp. OVS6]USK31129.1 M23 family metallopeptidase [Bacillus sp. CMF21]